MSLGRPFYTIADINLPKIETQQSNALQELDRSLGNAKLKELTELALSAESNRKSDKKICIGKTIRDNHSFNQLYIQDVVHCPFILKG